MTLWQMSLSGGLLILAISLVRKLTLDRLPKKTFLILWEIAVLRLLLPFSIPSLFSAWTLLAQSSSLTPLHMEIIPETTPLTAFPGPAPAAAPALQTAAAPFSPPFRLWTILWGIGAAAFALFFLLSWLRCRREFAASLPVTEDFTNIWFHEHMFRIKRKIRIRQSDRIRTPLTFGILRPVILLPKETDWTDHAALSFILLHESIHIRRCDALTKLLCTTALCIHWFNPAVYLLYFLLNQDLELACDEAVVQASGRDDRSAYALTLIRLEEARSSLFPFGSCFSGDAMKERITSIMNTRKKSIYTMIAAVALIVCMTAVFATSAAAEDVSSIPDTAFSEEEYQKLLALRPDGYEQMSVLQYQQKVWELTDTPQYLGLLERFSQDMQIYALRDENNIAAFLHYILNPLTGDRWQERDFSGCVLSSGNVSLEYTLTLSILDGQSVTVQQYDDARRGVTDGLSATLEGLPDELQKDQTLMEESVRQKIEALVSGWSTDSLKVMVDYALMLPDPMDPELTGPSYEKAADIPAKESDGTSFEPEIPAKESNRTDAENEEQREYPNATEEDYRALLTLKTPGYPDVPVRDFNAAVLAWGNTDDSGSLDRILCDIQWNDCQVPLTREEQAFVQTSVYLSCLENARYVQSQYTGRAEEEPSITESLPGIQLEENGRAAFCDLFYRFSWQIFDKDRLTVRERDQAVDGLRTAIRSFWTNTDPEKLLTMTEEELTAVLIDLAREYSTSKIALSTGEDDIFYESMDERDLE